MLNNPLNLTANPLKVGIIGLGRQSLNDHIPALLRRDDIEIVSISDISDAAHRAFFEMYPALQGRVKAHKNFEKVVDDDIDFAIVAVPHDQYLSIAQVLCENKIPFMKEKPFARTLEETISMASIDDIALYCFICTQRRFHPLYKKALTSIEGLGKVGSFDATYTLNLPKPASGWRQFSEVCGGGVIIDMGYHIIDQLIWWFGYPDDIYAKYSNLSTIDDLYDTEDSATIVFSYRQTGIQGSIVLSRCTGKKVEGYQIAGSEYFMEGDKEKLTIKERKSGETQSSEEHAYKDEMMDNQLEFFIDTITHGGNFEKNHFDNLLNMKFIERCYRDRLTKDHALFINSYKHRRSNLLSR